MKLCFLDLETTGLDPQKHGICEIGAILEIDGEPIDNFHTTIQPLQEDLIEDEALKVSGKTREILKTGMDPVQVLRAFKTFLAKHVDPYNRSDKYQMIGYNCLTFDSPFLRQWFHKLGDSYFGSWFWNPPLDLYPIAAFFLRQERHMLSNMKQATVATHFEIPFEEGCLHSAHWDASLSQKIYHHLISRKGL